MVEKKIVSRIDHIRTEVDIAYEQAKKHLLENVDKEKLRNVVTQQDSELEGGFFGFLHNYENALKYIPSKDFIVIDIGCYLAVQSVFFEEYAQYIGVDCTMTYDDPPVNMQRYETSNSTFYNMYGQQFISEELSKYDIDKCFVIMSAVPDFELAELVMSKFKHYYIAYPGMDTVIRA